ncbi:DUF2264 domain-containing protein [uncultured Phocaeicola sp.]|jgi:hypothetical protein|uniref:DUF2264 domain-containing protein n=1 Tax=uncultured Phocaeicola sp. TaxID=990718 RepID=UPI00258B07C9|nr:DUF2264 domain-containing protein [uncultured Phocaeicola sp.]
MKLRLITLALISVFFLTATSAKKKTPAPTNDRQQWVELCYRIAAPVLENMSKGELQKNMQLELSPTWDGRDKRVAYMETFGRLMAGISPWLALPDDDTEEGKMRKQIREWAVLSYKNAIDPDSPDFLLWETKSTQRLVDAAYIAESFLRAPEATWQLLDETTQKRYIERFQRLKIVRPAYNNWLLFRGLIEAFLMSVGEDADQYVLTVASNKINEWYLSDGWYSDGAEFSLDYYNAYVIHPMYIEMLEVLNKHRFWTPISTKLAIKRMQRFNVFMERLISPEGTYPAFGRSVVYRMGAFQTLAMAAWKYGLPEGLSNGQVRSALTAVMNNMFKVEGNFNEKGFLQLGFAGHQPDLSNYYTNNGSLYMTSLVFMPLGLPADHPFWKDAAEPWTSQKAWSGQPFPIDGHHSLRTE